MLPKALTRFRMPWRWDGQPVVLQSRAWDEAGNVQPTRAELFAERGEPKINPPVTAFPMGHMNFDHQLGDRQQGGGEACLWVNCLRRGPARRRLAGAALAADLPGLGKRSARPISPTGTSASGPTARGLPPGSGTAAQGAAIYAQKCEACHGKDGDRRHRECRAR